MEEIGSWIAAGISLILSTAITTFIGLMIKRYFKKYVSRKEEEDIRRKREEEELCGYREQKQREERRQDTLASVAVAVKPLEEKIDEINQKLDKVEDGTLSTLRNDILTCYYRCRDKGYHNDYDYQNIHHMYDSYAELHGNSYVADIMKRFDEEIPNKETFEQNQRKNIEKEG